MDNNEAIIEHLKTVGILPLFYHAEVDVCIEVVTALYEGGIRAIEFTNRGDAALENFKAIVELRNTGMPGLILAAGTIRTADQAKRFMDAGADFLISPVYDADVADLAYINKILWIPGCMTPTEIHEAEKAGCRLVKLFPGNVLGPGFVSAITELFPKMLFMPTGGVDVEKESMNAWFNAGVCAVGLGSKMITKAALEARNYNAIRMAAEKAVDMVKQYRE